MPLTYTGPADIVAKLEKVYRGAMPGDLASVDRDLDDAAVIAEMAALGEGQAIGWAREARLSTSHGIWLDQHARDKDMYRRLGEGDQSLIDRLKTGPEAVIFSAVYAAIAEVITAADPIAVFYLVRIPVDLGAFADTDCWCDVDSRVTPTRTRMTIALIPDAIFDQVSAAVLDAMRAKMPAGRLFRVERIQ